MIRSAVLSFLAATTALISTRWVWAKMRRLTSGIRFPPGPPGVPVLGNVFDIPPDDSHLAYYELAKQYGPIMHFNMLNQAVVVLSNVKIATDLLDKRGAIYSGRPPYYMAIAAGWGWNLGSMGHTDAWRVRRRLVHQRFNTNSTIETHDMMRKACVKLVRNLLRTPDNFRHHIRRSAAATIMSAVYGITVADENDPYVDLAEKANAVLGQIVMPGSTPVEILPFLLQVPPWVPFFGQWTKRARSLRKYPRDLVEMPYARTKEDISKSFVRPCMVTEHLAALQNSGDSNLTERVIKDASGVAYIAGADTTSAALLSWILAMVLWPEYQKQGQMELDRVLGDRLPDISDQNSLPYVEALIRETFRMYTVGPLAIPHAVDEDDIYDGMLIQKGTTVVANVWAMMHDEDTYPSAHSFNPGRFLKNGKIDDDVPNPRIIGTFGFGRRICPGRRFAEDSIFLTVATLLKCFDFRRHVENGVQVAPSGKFKTGIISTPLPFKCSIKPRSENIKTLVDIASDV